MSNPTPVSEPLLLPAPQHYEALAGWCELPDILPIHLQTAALWPLGNQAIDILATVHVTAECTLIPLTGASGCRLWLNPAYKSAEAYALRILPGQISLEAHDQAGLFYGLMTLKQLLRIYGKRLPALTIQDWPDFAARGVMLDVSRDKVPTLDTLKSLIDSFAEWKLNQLQLYTEHTFAYAGHEAVWEAASPLTPQDILTLDAYCRERFIELVPNQNSFGHMARWLKHPAYAPLSETGPEGFVHPWTNKILKEPFSLCPLDPGSLDLMQDLYAQLLPHFQSRMVNIGADETFDLGQGRSKAACESEGKGQVYLNFVRKLHGLVMSHGRLMQFWGDIVLNHPELIPELPRPCIALNWGYEAGHPFEHEGAHFARAGVPYYVCPGTSSWNTIGGRADNMQGNLLHAAEAGQLHGAVGYLITDWGDNGHWQPLPVSLPGFAYGAALAWATTSNARQPLAALLNAHVFCDSAGIAGETWLELGTLYRLTGVEIPNQTSLFNLLYWHDRMPGESQTSGLQAAGLEAALRLLETLTERIKGAACQRADSLLLQQEFELAAGLMKHSCQLAHDRLTLACDVEALPAVQRQALAADLRQLLTAYRELWLARNRPGGLNDSVRSLEALLTRYESDL